MGFVFQGLSGATAANQVGTVIDLHGVAKDFSLQVTKTGGTDCSAVLEGSLNGTDFFPLLSGGWPGMVSTESSTSYPDGYVRYLRVYAGFVPSGYAISAWVAVGEVI